MHTHTYISDVSPTAAATATAIIGEIILVSYFDLVSPFSGLVSLNAYMANEKLITLSFANTFFRAVRTRKNSRFLVRFTYS